MTAPDLDSEQPPLLVLTRRARRRLLGAAGSLLGLVFLPYVIPPLADLRPWFPEGSYVPFWNITGRLHSGDEEREEREQLAGFEELARAEEHARARSAEKQAREVVSVPPNVIGPHGDASEGVYPPYAGHPDDQAKVAVGIEGAAGLEHYFGRLALAELEVGNVIARAGQWGDSVLGGDGLTHAMRQKMQARFGDGGHGFHALSRYGIGYSHRGVRFQDRGGWRSCEIIFKCRPDQRYGYAGVSSGSAAGGTSIWQTAKSGAGDKASHFELWYQTGPEGGRFQVKIDERAPHVINTRAPVLGDAVEVYSLEDGAHSFEVRAIGGGTARGYGVVLERNGPGAVWDELSLIGSFTQRLDYQDREHIGWQLRRRGIDMMVFMFGGNDVQREYEDLKVSMERYEDEYRQVIGKFRAGRPEASCLVMSLIDHGTRVDDTIRTRPIVPRLVNSQRNVARAEGCAFFDTFRAMGGHNSIARWYRARPQLAAPDFSHPTQAGQSVIATLVYRALMLEYADFRQRKAGDALPEFEDYSEPSPEGDAAPGLPRPGRGAPPG